MSLFSKLLKRLFGSNQDREASYEDYTARWEQERKERMQAAEERLKPWVLTMLKEKGELPFTWESGNDEAFVTFDAFSEEKENEFVDLKEYVVDKLEIPDAGEFQMNGSGTIYIANNQVRAKYASVIKDIVDYNEETEEEVYGEEIQDSGERVLFEG